MKIALIILHADPARGGAERYTIDVAAAIARRGHDVSLLASSFAGAIGGVEFVDIPARGATRAARYRKFLDALDAHFNQTNYDIVHAMLPVRRCDVYHPHAGIALEQGRKWNALLNPRRRAMASVERRLLTSASPPIVIALSEYVKRSILRFYTLPDERLATLFNAVDLERFTPASDRESRKEVRGLIIANDFERKGVGEAIKAVEAVADRSLNLHVAGRGDVARYNVATHWPVIFHGPVDDPRPLYDDADFFVLPTKHDPCSLVVLEALAMGLPVISTVFNGATEIMVDGVHGYVLKDPTDIDALADAMRKMLDPQRRRAMREACLALRRKLSFDHHVDELLRIYGRASAARNA